MKPLAEEALHIWREKDCFAAVEHLMQQDDPLASIEAFHELMRHCYWQLKDLFGAITFGRAGAQHAFASAAHLDAGQADLARELRHRGKGFFYDIASFTWPGWNEQGIAITASDLATGFDAARTNLRLAEQLQRGDLPMSRAHWVLGAQRLAAGDRAAAREAFIAAAEYAEKANSRADLLLAHGYMHLVDLLIGPDEAARRQLDEVKRDLRGQEDGEFFIEQLETAQRVFASLK